MKLPRAFFVLLFGCFGSLSCDKKSELAVIQPSKLEVSSEGSKNLKISKSSLPVEWHVLSQAKATLEMPAVVRANLASAELSVTHASTVRRIHALEGSMVEVGAPILDIDSEELLLESATYLAVRSQLTIHQQRLEELSKLQTQKLVPRAQLFEQQAKIAELSRTKELAAASLRAAGLAPSKASLYVRRGSFSLVSPIAGIVSHLAVHVGQSVIAHGASLAQIVGRGRARVEVRSQGKLPRVKSLRFEGLDGRIVDLREAAVASIVDPQSGNLLSWFEPQNDELLPDGLAGSVIFDQVSPTFSVPGSWLEHSSKLLRLRDGDKVEIRVDVVRRSGGQAWVRGNLQMGDKVAKIPSKVIGEQL